MPSSSPTANANGIAASPKTDDILARVPHKMVGKVVGLCLPVLFSDEPGAVTHENIEAFCNDQNYRGFRNNGSVADYFEAVSDGNLTYKNIVAPYYTAAHPRSYYTDGAVRFPERARELVRETLEYHRREKFDFDPLTVDEHGIVHAVSILYAGNISNAYVKGLWPHNSLLTESVDLAGGKKVKYYQITPISQELELGSFCHEAGHMLCGFPDLYDTMRGRNLIGISGVYCLMGSGEVVDVNNPPQFCAYLKYRAGWATAEFDLTKDLAVSLHADKNDFAIYRNADNPAEYFIIEYRASEGRDAAIPASGLAVWHVNERAGDFSDTADPSQPTVLDNHLECRLLQADGFNDLGEDSNPGDPGDLFSPRTQTRLTGDTKPNTNWRNGSPSGLEIYDIAEAGTTMTFKVGNPDNG